MKQDNLEQYITSHREEFDTDNPPPMVWTHLERELDRHSKKKTVVHPLKRPTLWRVIQVAAMFVVVIGVGLLIGIEISKVQKYGSPHLLEFAETERHYTKEIDQLWKVVKASEVEEESTIKADLNALDKVYNELKNELLKDPNSNTETAVNAMLKNYNAKIEILQTVLKKYNNKHIDIEDGKIKI